MIKVQEPEIRFIPEKILVGKSLLMSHSLNRVGELWQSFIPEISKIKHRSDRNLISLTRYPTDYNFQVLNPEKEFEKFAGTEVSQSENLSEDLTVLTIPEGNYAVFLYRGDPRLGAPFFESIFTKWLPDSLYELDQRPHFEILDSRYKNNDPESEEEIWIPIKPRA